MKIIFEHWTLHSDPCQKASGGLDAPRDKGNARSLTCRVSAMGYPRNPQRLKRRQCHGYEKLIRTYAIARARPRLQAKNTLACRREPLCSTLRMAAATILLPAELK